MIGVGFLQKLLSAKLFNVISTKFLLMANPWRLDSTFKGFPQGNGTREAESCTWFCGDR